MTHKYKTMLNNITINNKFVINHKGDFRGTVCVYDEDNNKIMTENF